jgi:hypothetical protein
MSTGTTAGNIFTALVLSLPLTFLAAVVYGFYPIIAAALAGIFNSGDGAGGIGAVAGGTGASPLWVFLLVEPLLFLVIFALLRRRRSLS